MIINLPSFLYDSMRNPRFVYELLDPITMKCRYIGKTKNTHKRYKAHLQQSNKKRTHKECWISSLIIKGLFPIMRVVAVSTEEYINAVEKQEIIRRVDLTNSTSGGDGQTGITQETITKIRITKYKRKKIKEFLYRKNIKKHVVSYNIYTGEILTFSNCKFAATHFSASPSTIAAYCRRLKHYITYKNQIFRYIGERV